MKKLLFSLVVFVLCLGLHLAKATPLEDKITTLKKAIKDEQASKPAPTPGSPQAPMYANSNYVAAMLSQLLSQADNPNMEANVESQITQLLSAFSSDPVQKAGADLLIELRKERKDRADAAAVQIQAVLKHVSDTVLAAKKPEDLDALLVELQKFQGDRGNMYNPDSQALYQQVNSAFEFTKLWQNYLSHLTTGQSQLAQNDLQNLSQNNYSVGIIPRSRLLELLAPHPSESSSVPTDSLESQVQTIVKGITTLDQMEPALNKLQQLRANNGEAQQAVNALTPMVETYNGLKAGVPTNLNVNFSFNNGAGISAALQGQLLTFALQHYLDAYKGAAPTVGEKPQDFISRVVADATAREDWSLLQKALTAQGYLNRTSTFGMYAPNGGAINIDNLLIGLNQETAGQYAMAVVSYQTALKTPDTNVPAKLIGDKLDAIKKDHPKEYDDGMQMLISPVVRYYPGQIPGMPLRPGMPGYPMPQAPVLSIPAATNQVVAPAAPIPVPQTNAPPATK